jgi:hypothetical protein
MTRSFDAFDRDDFRNPDDLDRGASGGSESFWSPRVQKCKQTGYGVETVLSLGRRKSQWHF